MEHFTACFWRTYSKIIHIVVPKTHDTSPLKKIKLKLHTLYWILGQWSCAFLIMALEIYRTKWKYFWKKSWKTDAGQMKEYNHHNHVENRIKSISFAETTPGSTFSPCTLCPLTDIRTLVPKQWMHYMIVNVTDITQLLFFYWKRKKPKRLSLCG